MFSSRVNGIIKILSFTLIAISIPFFPCKADIYKQVLPDGTLYFTNCPIDRSDMKLYLKEKRKIKTKSYSGISRIPQFKLSNKKYDQLIQEYSRLHGVDPLLVKCVMELESGYNPMALSSKGAIGLMQLMPGTASILGVNPWDEEENIKGGTRYLADMLNRYNWDIEKALAAYNAGPGAVDKWGGIPPYQETQDYVRIIKANYNSKVK
ncbi:MAG TPA: lytic transglycosylase domain-containing protein [Desulfomonilia bacterium]